MNKNQMTKITIIIFFFFSLLISYNCINLSIGKGVLKVKKYYSDQKEEKSKMPMWGCIEFYDECDFKGDVILQLCDWTGTTVPKLSTEAANPKIKFIKSIKVSYRTELSIFYDIERIPQGKLTIKKDVSCLKDILPENSLVTILQVKYSGI